MNPNHLYHYSRLPARLRLRLWILRPNPGKSSSISIHLMQNAERVFHDSKCDNEWGDKYFRPMPRKAPWISTRTPSRMPTIDMETPSSSPGLTPILLLGKLLMHLCSPSDYQIYVWNMYANASSCYANVTKISSFSRCGNLQKRTWHSRNCSFTFS